MPILEVNLEQHRRLEAIFATLDVNAIMLELEAIGRVSPGQGTLLFLDEIQATPSAVAALRYLYEQRPDQPVVAAGSLLEMVLRSPEFTMPVGRIEYLHLGPLAFCEFLLGVGDKDLVDLSSRWSPGEPWADGAHRRLAARQREFLLVGGMPEAVAAYAAQEGIEGVRQGKYIEIDLADIHEPIVACPNDPDDVKTLSDVAGAKIDEVFIGSCMTNIGHFRAASKLLEGKRDIPVKLWVAPPTKMDQKQLTEEGHYGVFGTAGARTEMPGCSLCMGNQAQVREGATVMSTSTRNFPNRLGKNTNVYLGSAELAAI